MGVCPAEKDVAGLLCAVNFLYCMQTCLKMLIFRFAKANIHNAAEKIGRLASYSCEVF